MKYFLLVIPLALLGLSQCKKADQAPAKPEDQLPPATQTGANTLGCLIDGQAWVPGGNYLSDNLSVIYDPGYLGGALQIKADRYTGPQKQIRQALTFGAAYVDKAGSYPFALTGPNGVYYADDNRDVPCREFGRWNTVTYQTGVLTVTRFDLRAGIIAGTFTFTLAQKGCADTLKITQGRFDHKL